MSVLITAWYEVTCYYRQDDGTVGSFPKVFPNYQQALDYAGEWVCRSPWLALAVINKDGRNDLCVKVWCSADQSPKAEVITDEWAFMATCSGCNNDHGFVDVYFGECHYGM